MLKKFYAIIPVILLAVTSFSQETEPAANSAITGTRLPAGAVRVMPNSVPAEINDGLQKIVEAGAGKIVAGNREVLAWSGANYKKANAGNLVNQLQANLQSKGWTYEVGGTEGGITVFSVSQENPTRRAVLGFYVPTDDALVVAWTEVLSGNAANNPVENNTPIERVEQSTTQKSGNATGITGIWRTGGMSMIGDRNTVTGAVTPSNGSTLKYVFMANGRFEFIGLTQSTMYGCTTALFNDKRGKFEFNGSQVTLIPDKNFWRNTNSCSPSSTKERDYTLERETYNFRTKTDEYGKSFICLANAKGETCYRHEDK